MIRFAFLIVFNIVISKVICAVQNGTCPVVESRELDLKGLDGKWYVVAAATEVPMQGECAMIIFAHRNYNTTDMSIRWVKNGTISHYNGTVVLTMDPTKNNSDLLLVNFSDHKTELYAFLDVKYDHYASILSCKNNEDEKSSSYELWKLIRTPYLKKEDATKLDQAIAKYNLQDTTFVKFNSSEATCKVSAGSQFDPSTMLMSSVAAMSLLKRLF